MSTLDESVSLGELLDNAVWMEMRYGRPVALEMDALKSAYLMRSTLRHDPTLAFEGYCDCLMCWKIARGAPIKEGKASDKNQPVP